MRIKVRVAIGSLLAKARSEAEEECGLVFDDRFATEVLRYCIRKLERIGQTEEYLPLLYRCELVQHQQMRSINAMSNSVVQKGVSVVCVNIA